MTHHSTAEPSRVLPGRKRQWRYPAVSLTVLLAAAVVLDGAAHRAVPPAEGTNLSGLPAASQAKSTLRIASYNIHGCRNAAGELDPRKTVKALEGFDLIGLNEVHGASSSGGENQAAWLGQQLQMPWLFAPTTRRWWRDDFGNGLLCRLPVQRWQRVPLAGTRHKGHRNMVLAQVVHGGRVIHLLLTHIDRRHDRALQLQEVVDRFLSLPEPALLMGDLNTMADDPLLERLLATPGVTDLVAEGLGASPPRIDWLLARGLRATSAGIVETGASDHPLVWAEVEFIGE